MALIDIIYIWGNCGFLMWIHVLGSGVMNEVVQYEFRYGVGVLKLISPQAKFSIKQMYLLCSLNHIHIWQLSPQLSCSDTC